MNKRYRSSSADVGLRGIGVLLCVVSYMALSRLLAVVPPLPDQTVGVECYVLAAIGFLSASVGSAMACLGKRLFDPVEIGARWGSGRTIPQDDVPLISWYGGRDVLGTRWDASFRQARGRHLDVR